MLPKWYDVDTLDDVKSLYERNKSSGFSASLSFGFIERLLKIKAEV